MNILHRKQSSASKKKNIRISEPRLILHQNSSPASRASRAEYLWGVHDDRQNHQPQEESSAEHDDERYSQTRSEHHHHQYSSQNSDHIFGLEHDHQDNEALLPESSEPKQSVDHFHRFLYDLQQEAALNTPHSRKQKALLPKPLPIRLVQGALSSEEHRHHKQQAWNPITFDPPTDVEGLIRSLSQDPEKVAVHHKAQPTKVPEPSQPKQEEKVQDALPHSSHTDLTLLDRSPPQYPKKKHHSQPDDDDPRHELVRFESFRRRTLAAFARNAKRRGVKEDLISVEDMHRRNRNSIQEAVLIEAAEALRDDPEEMEERFGSAWDMLCENSRQEESIGEAMLVLQSRRIGEVFDCYVDGRGGRRVYWS